VQDRDDLVRAIYFHYGFPPFATGSDMNVDWLLPYTRPTMHERSKISLRSLPITAPAVHCEGNVAPILADLT
jgi:hypothetical protein